MDLIEKTDKRTLILGATARPGRYAGIAAERLRRHGHSIVPLGIGEGETAGQRILTDPAEVPADIHTVTLYINPRRQPQYYDFLLQLKPQRIIFNPGTENAELESLAEAAGIETLEACTLVMLATGSY